MARTLRPKPAIREEAPAAGATLPRNGTTGVDARPRGVDDAVAMMFWHFEVDDLDAEDLEHRSRVLVRQAVLDDR